MCNETLVREPELESNSSCTSKTSDVSCVGISSVDLFDVDSVNSSHEALPKLENIGEQERETQQMLYNLYTISVSVSCFMVKFYCHLHNYMDKDNYGNEGIRVKIRITMGIRMTMGI